MRWMAWGGALGAVLVSGSAAADVSDKFKQAAEKVAEKSVDALDATTRKWLGKHWPTCRFRYFSRLGDRAGFSFALGMYGNWCGPSRSGGDALDAFDACCRSHDRCCDAERCSPTDACSKRCDGCDDRFWACVSAARAAAPGRFGEGKRYLYPCRDCRSGDHGASSARRYRCNQGCRAAMFAMKRGERCSERAPCRGGLTCKKGKCRAAHSRSR